MFVNFALFASLAFVGSATRFCQCENEQKGRIFSGINQVCNTLNSNWCSTKCNVFGADCNYCQFTPAGTGDDESYDKLKSWCYQQYGSENGQQYNGNIVNCYSYKNASPKGFLGTGCAYQNNGDFAPAPSVPEPKDPARLVEAYQKALEGKAALRIVPKPAIVKYSYLRSTTHCDFIYPTSAQKIQDAFLAAAKEIQDPPECRVDYEPNHIVECGLIDEARIAKYKSTFQQLCHDISGNDAHIEGQKLEAARAGVTLSTQEAPA
ncbi:hypothetical protein B0O99DRAFT_595631 [Bisporella sp. PMI_857]|nr:hypothetical protein B0O99DRAFT_595631 [Bisporella sp. PMI_857]